MRGLPHRRHAPAHCARCEIADARKRTCCLDAACAVDAQGADPHDPHMSAIYFQTVVSLPIFEIFSTHCSGVTLPRTTTFFCSRSMSYDSTPAGNVSSWTPRSKAVPQHTRARSTPGEWHTGQDDGATCASTAGTTLPEQGLLGPGCTPSILSRIRLTAPEQPPHVMSTRSTTCSAASTTLCARRLLPAISRSVR